MARATANLKALLKAIDEKKDNPESLQEYALAFINDLYSTIHTIEKKNSHPSSNTFKPSSMKCPRNMQYQILGIEPEVNQINPTLVRICECGSDSHLRLQHWINKMKECGFECEYINVSDFVKSRNLTDLEIVKEPTEDDMETKLYNKKYNISFMCDGIIRYKNIYFILEIKTESTYKHSKRNEMAEEHIPQVCAYYLSFGIPDIMMLYENRDICTHKAYAVKVTDSMVRENVLNKIEEVNNCVKNGTLASTNISASCRYCSYANKCKQDGGC